MKLFLLFVIQVIIDSSSDAFNFMGKNKSRYKDKYNFNLKISHILNTLNILLWLYMFFFSLNILGKGESTWIGFLIVLLGYILVRIGLFNVTWSLLTKNGICYIGNTDPIYDMTLRWLFVLAQKKIKIKNKVIQSILLFLQKFLLFLLSVSPIICLVYGFILLNNYLR